MKKKEKQTVLWTIYHTVLAVELAIIIAIELYEQIQRSGIWVYGKEYGFGGIKLLLKKEKWL